MENFNIQGNRRIEEQESANLPVPLQELGAVPLNFAADDFSLPIPAGEKDPVFITPQAAQLLLTFLDANPATQLTLFNAGGPGSAELLPLSAEQLRRLMEPGDEQV